MAGADPDSRDSQEVSPFQLAVWQNQLEVARYLVERCGVDPKQLNVFAPVSYTHLTLPTILLV